MKKRFILIILLAAALALPAVAAPQFFLKGLDITALTNITAAQLNQLIENAVPTNRVGFIMRTNGRPSTAAFAGYTNFLWYDTTFSPPSLKGYVCCGDADTNWIAASVGFGQIISANLASPAVNIGQIFANAIVTSNLANNAVTDVKISAGAINNSHLQGGSVSNANIALGTITGDRLAVLTITDTNIASSSITEGKLASPLTTAKIAAGGSPSLLATTSGGLVVWTNCFRLYSSNNIAIATGNGSTTHAHMFGVTPTFVAATLVCDAPEASFSAGEEIDARAAMTEFAGNSVTNLLTVPFYEFGWDSANIYVTSQGASNVLLRAQSSLAWTVLTKANWHLRLDAFKMTPTP